MKPAAVVLLRQRVLSCCRQVQGCQPPPKIWAGMWVLWAGCKAQLGLSCWLSDIESQCTINAAHMKHSLGSKLWPGVQNHVVARLGAWPCCLMKTHGGKLTCTFRL